MAAIDRLTLRIGRLNLEEDDVRLVTPKFCRDVSEALSIGSTKPKLPGAQPTIDLAVDPNVVDLTPANDSCKMASKEYLIDRLSALLGANDDHSSIGLIFATWYANVIEPFGYMFDEPRRTGAAVFLKRIDEKRSDVEFYDQVLYTTIHEIGHVLNLEHALNHMTYMAPSQPNVNWDPGYFQFRNKERLWMSQTGEGRSRVRPGTRWLGKARREV